MVKNKYSLNRQVHKVCTCLFLLIFIKNFGCNGYKENELNTILEESLLFKLGQN